MKDLFIQQSESGLQWYVCQHYNDGHKIIWIEYSEREAKDMKECILRLGGKCRKRKKK